MAFMAGSERLRAKTILEEDVSVDASTDIRDRDEPGETAGRLPRRNGNSLKAIRHIHQSLLNAGYELGDVLDEHDNCHVHLARSLATGQSVVAKVIVDQAISQSSALVRFHLEAKALAALEHPNLVRVIDHGEVSGVNYMILEFAGGENLANQVARSGPMTPALAISCVQQAALALAYLHQRGVIHRDVKPANLVLTPKGRVVLIDLGLARMSDGNEGSITRLFGDRVLGTADYMSPEQAIDCHQVDPRADVYSLGCTLYFLLAGRAPFFGDTLAARLMEHQACEPPALTGCEGTPERLIAMCLRMMAKQPADRFQNAMDVAEELARC
jgi:serine/threonine protein kinase